jgi:hypothetical protein
VVRMARVSVVLAVVVLLHFSGPASARREGAEGTSAAASPVFATAAYAIPKCPRRFRAVVAYPGRRWRAWYRCYRSRAQPHYRRPIGCKAGQELWVRRAGHRRGWQCRSKVPPPTAPTTPDSEPTPTKPDPSPTQPQPSPPRGVTIDQQLLNHAFNAAVARGSSDLAASQYGYGDGVYWWWINAGVDGQGNVVSPIITPFTYGSDGLPYPYGCRILTSGFTAACTLVEAVRYFGDSSIAPYRAAIRWLVYAELGGDGRIYAGDHFANEDYPRNIWYYICIGPPQFPDIPVCT